MELKPGYKQTEVGVIPADWEVKLLPDVLHFRSGKAHEQYISDSGDYVCVNSKFISTGGSVRKHSSANFSPARKGDVLMVMSDLPNGRALAKAYFVEADNTYAVNQRVCALTAYRDCSVTFRKDVAGRRLFRPPAEIVTPPWLLWHLTVH
jgi:type I restriction enzyme S subunit